MRTVLTVTDVDRLDDNNDMIDLTEGDHITITFTRTIDLDQLRGMQKSDQIGERTLIDIAHDSFELGCCAVEIFD